MRNIMITIEYDGTNYGGWQKQNNTLSIQQVIEEAIYKITKERVNLISSGRTDAGVHAIGQVANFMTNSKILVEKIPNAINSKLPNDISVVDAKEVSFNFHARYSAKKKRYKYVILNSKYKRPIYRNYSYYVKYDLDIDKMKEEIKFLIGEHDFKSFMSSGSSVKTTVRTIYDVNINKQDDLIILEFEGNGFLYNMVRIIVGTLVDIGRGKIDISLKNIIDCKDRNKAGHTAPACGLFLKKVYY
ncbi:tRNA pseudouridine(38-40) synthase TruA [Tepidibacter thalassicus]|uniref:tRNA pseudouridine synthase A n=1 Tax=Tepidibacter thalassicus DSM 15285 TaxID=1123350 RepID=A0A1M5T2L9_9FIRM|nr:tRNA pseudouridine(38-40) synthase TruA [Tepidibacter thalassicus]SHH44995.1 tRNA pseudouridine38-40 synthase [Tepidibacter thalassicus DSM 15285]